MYLAIGSRAPLLQLRALRLHLSPQLLSAVLLQLLRLLVKFILPHLRWETNEADKKRFSGSNTLFETQVWRTILVGLLYIPVQVLIGLLLQIIWQLI